MEHVESHTGRLLGTVPAKSMKSTAFRFFRGDILYGRLRPYLNKVHLAEFEGLCSSEFIVLPPSEAIMPEFLSFRLRHSSFVEFANHQNQGDRPRVSFEQIAPFSIALPPKKEQERIVAKLQGLLGRVDDCQKRLERVPLSLKRFRQVVLAAACSGRLPASDGGVGNLPQGWEVAKLGTLFRVASGATPNRKISRYFEGGKIPWVRTADVQNGEINEVAGRITKIALEETNVKVFPPGTLLIAMYGEGRTRGQVARLGIPAATNQACAALINAKMDEATRQYVFYCLLGNYQKLRAEALGGNQPNLSLGIIREWIVPMPPKAERGEIVRRVRELLKLADDIESRYDLAKASVDRLSQSILARAFQGELVPQAPKNEPASKFLDRIQIEESRPQHVSQVRTRRRGASSSRPKLRQEAGLCRVRTS